MRNSLNFIIIFIIINIQFNYVLSQMEIGDQCTIYYTRKTGSCKIVSECPEVLEHYRLTSQLPTVCRYQNRVQIVCCPNINSTTSPPMTNPTTTQAPKQSKRVLKCIEYADAVYDRRGNITLPNGTIQATEIDRCAITEIPLVHGATYARPREFPHSALLGYKTEDATVSWGCGGALISEAFVVTAASCTKSNAHGNVKYCRFGDMAGTDYCKDALPITFMISEIILHPKYSPSSYYNDIALLRLDGEVTFNPAIRPICLPSETTLTTPPAGSSNKIVVSTGWGTIDSTLTSTNSLYFSKVALDLFTYRECYVNYQNSIDNKLNVGIIDEMQICAGTRVPFWRPCYGDSGGPLQIIHPNLHCMHELIGVSSFGKACGTLYILEVYTRLDSYSDWIENIVWPD